MRQKRAVEAQQAFAQVLERVPNHRLVQGVLVVQSMAGLQSTSGSPGLSVAKGTFDERFGASIVLDLMGQTAFAAQTMDSALTDAPPGNAGWLLPVEPLLNVPANPDAWAAALSRLRARAT